MDRAASPVRTPKARSAAREAVARRLSADTRYAPSPRLALSLSSPDLGGRTNLPREGDAYHPHPRAKAAQKAIVIASGGHFDRLHALILLVDKWALPI